jgi:hypothetical protein
MFYFKAAFLRNQYHDPELQRTGVYRLFELSKTQITIHFLRKMAKVWREMAACPK